MIGPTVSEHWMHLQDGNIRDTLRVHTRGVHEQLHQHSHFVALFDQTINLPQYTALLQRFHGFYIPLERAIARIAAQAPYHYTHRAALLERDLDVLAPRRAPQPHCAAIEQVVTPASLAGVVYVIEGSTLGATQIDRAAQKLLSKDHDQGRAFWAWSRAHNSQCWAAMNHYLDALDVQGVDHAPIVAGANATFQALTDWLAPLELDES